MFIVITILVVCLVLFLLSVGGFGLLFDILFGIINIFFGGGGGGIGGSGSSSSGGSGFGGGDSGGGGASSDY